MIFKSSDKSCVWQHKMELISWWDWWDKRILFSFMTLNKEMLSRVPLQMFSIIIIYIWFIKLSVCVCVYTYVTSKSLYPYCFIPILPKTISLIFLMTLFIVNLQLANLVYVHHLYEALKNSTTAFYYLQISSFRLCTNFLFIFLSMNIQTILSSRSFQVQFYHLSSIRNLNKAKCICTFKNPIFILEK